MIIGIDPGQNTGIAMCDGGKLINLVTSNFWGAIECIDKYPLAFFIVESPNTKSVWHNRAKSVKTIQRTGVNVGSCLREAELIIDYLNIKNVKYKSVHPSGKINAAMFKKITGFDGRTNQHTRDAGMMAFMGFK